MLLKNKLPLYAFTIALFCSATLMFYIQPLMGKWLLPIWGGTPQIWNTCMIFFQAVLFAGYCYVHYSGKFLTIKRQVILHIIFTVIALLIFPISLSSSNISLNEQNPQWGIITTLFVSVGIPMFIISSTAPLLQKWFSHLDNVHAKDPYFLYVASNAGSLFALISYPIIIEPLFGISQQIEFVKILFVFLAITLSICTIIFFKDNIQHTCHTENTPKQNINWRQRFNWFVLAFLPSSLLLGVTTYITTDVASAPLFWIIPLMIYLLTFILAFSKKNLFVFDRILYLQAFFIIFTIIIIAGPPINATWGKLGILLAVFLLTAYICHFQLAQQRPDVGNLTEFYLWLSLGGVLGGAFNTLLAPLLFNRLLEFQLALTLACTLRPSFDKANTTKERWKNIIIPVALLSLLCIIFLMIKIAQASPSLLGIIGFLLIIFACYVIWQFKENTIRFSLSVGLLLIAMPLLQDKIYNQTETLQITRNFFGIYHVYYDKNFGFHIMRHGTTIHGAQKLVNHQLSMQPVTYYYKDGPFGEIFTALGNQLGTKSVGLIGLGVGGLSCYGNQGSHWTFYEIDPLVEEVARDEHYFSYLKNCPPTINVVIGDARLKLKDAPSHYYEMIILDAFSSDAIPTHLLTKEALMLYMEKLSPTGVLVLHLSNRYLDLESIVGNLAQELSLTGRIKFKKIKSEQHSVFDASASLVAVLAKNEQNLGLIAHDNKWHKLTTNPHHRLWTDDYVNIWSALGKIQRPASMD